MSLEETKSKVKNMSPSWKFFIFFKDKWLLLSLLWLTLWLVDLAEWTSYDWLLQQSDHRCLITANCPIILSNYSCTEWWVKNEAANAPITFGKIVMVMIIAWITCSRHSVGKTKCDSKQCYSSREVKKWERLGLSHSINEHLEWANAFLQLLKLNCMLPLYHLWLFEAENKKECIKQFGILQFWC